MKLCRYCGKEYPENYFGVALTTKNKVYRRHKCRYCYFDTKKSLSVKRKQWIDNFKRNGSCSGCGISDYRVLDFHHKGKEKKEFGIAFGNAEKYGFSRIKREIEKCELLCANCHRIKHSK